MIPYKGKYKITQIYKGVAHQGVDLVGISSKRIYAPVSGKVIAAEYDTYPDGGMGLYVKILGDDKLYHLMAHLSAVYAIANQIVKEGQYIGDEGNTGHSFGSHCHYEIRKTQLSSSFIDVCKYIGIPNEEGTYMSSDKEAVKLKYGFSDSTMDYLNKHPYPASLFNMMLRPANEQHYQIGTINYILKYEYGKQIFEKLG